jgi:hypothetical protein
MLDPGQPPSIRQIAFLALAAWHSGSLRAGELTPAQERGREILTLVGVYGVVSYVVTRRRGEFGIRLTLGATPRDVQRLVVLQTLRPIAVGVAIGIAGGAAASQELRAVLLGISRFDPIAFVARRCS